MKNTCICIGRQFGSGGHEIGIRVAEALGIQAYEKDILHLACLYGELPVKMMEKADEKATNPYLFQTIHEGNFNVARGKPVSEVLFELQSHEIRRLARENSCVFVGRCADYVLRAEDVNLLRIFIKAPLALRIRRKAEQEKMSEDKARRTIQSIDKQRRKYYETYTGQKWGDPQYYDLNIEIGDAGIPAAVEDILEQVRLMEV